MQKANKIHAFLESHNWLKSENLFARSHNISGRGRGLLHKIVYNGGMEYKQTFSHFAELSAALLSVDRDELKKAIELLRKTKERRRYVWIVGNGGSAATAEHLANDLTKMCGIKAIAIPSMTPTMTAYGNDEGWQNMFACPMDVFFEPGDVVVAISCSGRSPNVLQAVANLDDVIILTGNDIGSPLIGRRASAILVAESSDITIQEDVHLAICHAIAKALAK